jgi:parallel beta-helix repeat protein
MYQLFRGEVTPCAGRTSATCRLLCLTSDTLQIDGTRRGAPPTQGGANIEMGGPNSDQLIEFVRSFDPRGWSCLHIAEGPLTCNNATVQDNDIGPCGSDAFQEWADGVSLSCKNSVVQNNMIVGPTDGGIVLFGAPGSRVINNTIVVGNVSPSPCMNFLQIYI